MYGHRQISTLLRSSLSAPALNTMSSVRTLCVCGTQRAVLSPLVPNSQSHVRPRPLCFYTSGAMTKPTRHREAGYQGDCPDPNSARRSYDFSVDEHHLRPVFPPQHDLAGIRTCRGSLLCRHQAQRGTSPSEEGSG
ncbi:hypothetical protein MRX96_032929 [Rhipicephalus microplus]